MVGGKKHNVKLFVVSGEAGEVKSDTISSWKEQLPEIIDRYVAKDIWNLDKTGCC